MTLPHERYNAVEQARRILMDMMLPENKVPKPMRERARRALKHFPSAFDMEQLAEGLAILNATFAPTPRGMRYHAHESDGDLATDG